MQAEATAPQVKSLLSSVTLFVFIVTLFLSASIMFAIQPMIGKMLLPIVGGTPAGWIVAMAFFQMMLLVGYFVAHILSKTGKITQGIVYLALLALGVSFMPLDLQSHISRISANPGATDIFLLLTFAVAVPFIALSATSSTIQRLFTASDHPYAHDPYFLYAASNLGSFSGLLLYPLVAEPLWGLQAQAQYLFAIYMGLITFALICILISAKKSNKEKAAPTATPAAAPAATIPATESGKAPGAKKWLTWLFLSFVPSGLLMAVTVYITTDIISAPMIWVLPLALYLMTFVIAFARKPVIPQKLIETLHPPLVIAAIVTIYGFKDTHTISWTGMVFFLIVFTVAALSCHMRLAALRPLEENSKGLTAFYLMMSVGGALGGMLNAFVIPFVTNRLIELPLILIISVLIHPAIRKNPISFYMILGCIALTLCIINMQLPSLPYRNTAITLYVFTACFIYGAFNIIKNPKSTIGAYTIFLTGSAVLLLLAQFSATSKSELYMTRNFYGTVRVFDQNMTIDGAVRSMRFMRHGTTTHGSQINADGYRMIPTAYFDTEGPLGDLFNTFKSENVLIAGLGVGTINCFNKGKTPYTFIEIDPAVADVAHKYFTYLSDCNKAAPAKVIIGDGRLELTKFEPRSADMIILDAFSSDSIPTHLLTVDALQEYAGTIKNNGIIAANLSNRYFNLFKIMSRNAKEAGLHAYFKHHVPEDITFRYPSFWLVMAKDEEALKPLAEMGWITRAPPEDLRPWTDDYTNLMSMLEFKL